MQYCRCGSLNGVIKDDIIPKYTHFQYLIVQVVLHENIIFYSDFHAQIFAKLKFNFLQLISKNIKIGEERLPNRNKLFLYASS